MSTRQQTGQWQRQGRWRLWLALMLFAAAMAAMPGYARKAARVPTAPSVPLLPKAKAAPAVGVTFTDVTRQAEIAFRHNSGAFGKKWLPETIGAGCAFFDYDGDDWQDILLLNSMDWAGHKDEVSTSKLYRNKGNGTFEDVTSKAGLAVEMYALGCAVGDYDNDGDNDLYITCMGSNYLFRNDKGKFTDVTASAGVGCLGFSTSCAFLDYDKDGDLDLFVCNYVKWTPQTDIWCTLDGVHKSYCTPELYPGDTNRLYRNEGQGRFSDVTKAAGIFNPQGKSLGVTVCDYNNDGWLDIAVANDTVPNFLYHNNGNGTFKEVGVQCGIAYGETGVVRSGMGIDAADYDNSGRESILITNFSNEMIALYYSEGSGLFVDIAPVSQVGQVSLLFLGFGCFFFDHDLDGKLDIFVANGHIDPDIQWVQKDVPYKQRPLLFRNVGRGKFVEVGSSGEVLRRAVVGRGAAYADYDKDGDLDVLLTVNQGSPLLLRNEGGNRNNYLRLRLVGTKSNHSAIGAKVTVRSGSLAQTRLIRSGFSYCSQSEQTLTFGLGQARQADEVHIAWPTGKRQKFTRLPANQELRLTE